MGAPYWAQEMRDQVDELQVAESKDERSGRGEGDGEDGVGAMDSLWDDERHRE